MVNNVIENDHGNVSHIMNEYYVNITRSIGNDESISIDDQFEDILKTHPSVLRIKKSIKHDRHFSKCIDRAARVSTMNVIFVPSISTGTLISSDLPCASVLYTVYSDTVSGFVDS